MLVKFKLFTPDTQLRRAHPSDAGVDVFLGKAVSFLPHETRVISLGFGISIPYNFVAYLENRTSVAMSGLSVAHCPIDPMYTGEVCAIVTNTTKDRIIHPANKALCQFVIQPFQSPELVPAEDWDDVVGARRGANGFGSSNQDN